MLKTALFNMILEKAEEIKNKFGAKCVAASHIAAAASDFCLTKYSGFLPPELARSACFEEERLRYVFSKEMRMASYLKIKLSKNSKEKLEEAAFDLKCCERVAVLRKADLLTADILFLCALKQLEPSYKAVVKRISSDDDIIAALSEADKNVYDYVIDKIDALCSELKIKSDLARQLRDWKPAKKFVEPEKLIDLAFDGIDISYSDNAATIKIPHFFGSSALTVSVHKSNGIYYAHDNKCALKFLARNIKNKDKYERAVKKVCHNARISAGRITGNFTDEYGFVDYLKDLTFAAHADLYYSKAKNKLCFKDKGYTYISADKSEPFDESVLTDIFKRSLHTYYDEDFGLCCRPSLRSSPFTTRFYFLIETLDNGQIRLSDKLKGKYEGELFEACYWYNDSTDISVFGKFISKLSGRFGADFDGKNVYLTDKPKNFQNALFRFFQLAVIISIFGHDIALPKIKKKVK